MSDLTRELKTGVRAKLVLGIMLVALFVLLFPPRAAAVECVGDWSYWTAVSGGCTSITGLLSIDTSTALTNLDGLSALTSVGGSLSIDNNNALTNLDGLSALTSVGDTLSIRDNNALANVDGLSALLYVNYDIWIRDNTNLCQQSVDNLVSQLEYYRYRIVTGNDGSCVLGAGGIVANLETPILGIDGVAADATGISNVQGWAYTTTPGAEIERHVEVFIDGEFAMLVPCCGDRGDVEAAGGPLLAGFSGVYNWGLLESGAHELKVVIASTIGEELVIYRDLNTARFGDHPFVREMEFTNGSGGEYTGGTLSCETVPISAPENMSSQATVRCFNWLAEAPSSSTLCEGNNPDNALYLAFDRSSQSFKTVPVPENSCFR
ncbi:MAG: hypothetical protein P8R45_04730 [Candidatus Binatia bacterium]|nr:hypothetical protein [Candidatus Binatia bacterium]